MTLVVGLIIAAAFMAWRRHRASVKDTRSGLVSERPVFYSDPPQRRMGNRSREAL